MTRVGLEKLFSKWTFKFAAESSTNLDHQRETVENSKSGSWLFNLIRFLFLSEVTSNQDTTVGFPPQVDEFDPFTEGTRGSMIFIVSLCL